MSYKLNKLDIEAIKKNWVDEFKSIQERVDYYKKELQKMSWKSSFTPEEKLIIRHAKEFAIALRSGNELVENFKDTYKRQSKELLDLLDAELLEIQEVEALLTVARVDLTEDVKPNKPLPKKLNEAKNKRIFIVGLVSQLADLNSDWDLEDKNLINEKDLQTIILKIAWIKESDNQEQVKNKLKVIFKNVTWEETLDFSTEDVKKFHEKLLFSLNFLNSLWIWSWINAVLSWKIDEFVNLVDLSKLKPRELDKETYEKLSPATQNIVWALVTIWVLTISWWLVIVWHEAMNFESKNFIEKFNFEKENPNLSKWLNFLNWIKEAFMWRRLSISFWQDKMTVAEMEKKVYDFTKEVMSLKLDWTEFDSIKNPILKSNYNYVSRLLEKNNKPEIKIALQKALIQSYILSVWKENEWEDYRFTLWLLFIWWHRDNISVNYIPVKADKDLLAKDREFARRALESSDFEKAWISIEKLENKNFKHIIPKAVQFDGDDRQFEVEIIPPEWVDLENSKKMYDMHFTLDLDKNKYIVTFSEKENQNIVSVWWDIQNISTVRNIREWNEVLNDKTLAQVLYDIVWHQVVFWKLAKAISRWDLEWTKNEISLLEKHFIRNKKISSYLKLLKNNISSFAIWDTYMSGNRNTKALKSPSYDKIRLKNIIRAENALAKKMWFPLPWNEENFEIKWNYSSKQISEIIVWQELTSVQFMTPIDRNNIKWSRAALHRVSVYDGSFAVSEKTVFINEEVKKRQIIEWMLNSSHESRWIKNQLNKLNWFLAINGIDKKISLDEYKDYLISWDINKLWVERLKLQNGKETKFLEARAMIAGNICLNLTYAIGYPAFELNGIKQEIVPAWSVDMQTSLNLPVAGWEESAWWISILWALSRWAGGWGRRWWGVGWGGSSWWWGVGWGGSSWWWGIDPWVWWWGGGSIP